MEQLSKQTKLLCFHECEKCREWFYDVLTSLPPAWSCAVPPFAQRTGTFMALPESAMDRAAWPSPTTITPLIGMASICSHKAVRTFAENLIRWEGKGERKISDKLDVTSEAGNQLKSSFPLQSASLRFILRRSNAFNLSMPTRST